MARKIKIGLDYFPHSCSLDDELEYIIAIHKEVGYYVYFRLLERIYNNLGYYINWDKKNIALFSNSINVDINKVNDVINDCLSEHLFDKLLNKKYNILTSKGIQQRYFEAIDRRKEAEIIKEYILLNDDYINKVNVVINWLNVDKSTQSKVEKSKVEESISFDEFWNLYNKKVGNKKKCKNKWDKLKYDKQKTIIQTLPEWLTQFSDKQFQPHPETYLNNERWNDEIIKPKKQVKNNFSQGFI